MITADDVLQVLKTYHMGAENGAHIRHLALEVAGSSDAGTQRRLRLLVSALRQSGEPICAHPSKGYFYAADVGEINDTCLFLYARAMHSLKQISALKNKAVPDLAGQLGLDVDHDYQ